MLTVFQLVSYSRIRNNFPPGMIIAGVPVGGLSQQEAAQRYAARPGGKQFGAISVFLQAAYDVAPGHKVDASCFYPKPDIESYLLHLVRAPEPHVFPPAVKTVIRACFQQRRKQVGGLLRGLLPDRGEAWLVQLAAAGLSGQTRAEAIPVEHWRQLKV